MKLALTLKLASADLLDEWPSALCMTLAVAAILAPILVLFSLRAGILTGMESELGSSAKVRELLTIGEPEITDRTIAKLSADKRISFIAPRTRLLAAGAIVRAPGSSTQTEVDMVPTGKNDPWLDAPLGAGNLAMSQSAAQKVNAKVGDKVNLLVDRYVVDGQREVEITPLTLSNIVPASRSGDGLARALVPLEFLLASERWRENADIESFADAKSAIATETEPRTYAGLRMYASDIGTVIQVRESLLAMGLDTDSQAEQIRLVQRLEGSLTIAIGTLAALMLLGLVLALGAIQWSWVERKRYEYSYLRLLGLGRMELAMVPISQGFAVCVFGIIIAATMVIFTGPFLNALFANQVGGLGTISVIRPIHILLVGALGLLVAFASALIASSHASRTSPIFALRRT